LKDFRSQLKASLTVVSYRAVADQTGVHMRFPAKLLVLAIATVATFASPTKAQNSASIVLISADHGGNIIEYALQAAEYKKDKTNLRVVGLCDSACTMYLTLPAEQLCVAPTSQFRFHAPLAANDRARKSAQDFLMAKYPRWVRDWIKYNGGLTTQLIAMDYGTSSKFLATCESVVAQR
jgi:hypothetical protein